MARDYAAVPHEYREEMAELTDAEFGRLVRALLDYSASGKPMRLEGNERFYVARVTAEEDRHKRSYEAISGARSAAGKAGAAARWNKEGKASDDKSKQYWLSLT